jgi:AcrR family transcriptional regulator
MLQKHEFSALTMSKLGKRVGASTMALYTYFPSRNALLDAVADHIFSQLVLPPESATWEVATVEWINALYSHFERFPVACRLIMWDQHVPPAWTNVWLPVLRILAKQGLRGRQLAFAATWIADVVLGIVRAHCSSLQQAEIPSSFEGKNSSAEDDRMLVVVNRNFRTIKGRRILKFAFPYIISSLEALFAEAHR